MASTYLTRTPSTAGDQQTFTVSAWVKRAALGGHAIFAAGTNSTTNGYFTIYFSSDALRVRFYEGSSKDVVTSALYRDTSAWYHVVVKVDTTQATAADRVIIYVNGEEQDKASATYVSQNFNTSVNNTTVQHVGANRDSGGGIGTHFDGEMAHFHLTDGTAYAASTFGETDSTTGIWKPKTAPSVTYGTNGFFLKFENSSSMGTDSSGNSNTFTVNGTMTQTVDTPSNVFATWNGIADNLDVTLSNGNTTVAHGSNLSRRPVISSLGASTGKYYAEFKPLSVSGSNQEVGIVSQPSPSTQGNYIGQSVQNAGYVTYVSDGNINMNGTSTSGYSTMSANDIIGIAVDMTNKLVYFYKNGTLVNSGGTNFSTWTTGDGNFYFCNGDRSGSSTYTLNANFGNGYFGTTAVSSAENPDDGIGIFEYDVPAGYRALCTKSINAEEYS